MYRISTINLRGLSISLINLATKKEFLLIVSSLAMYFSWQFQYLKLVEFFRMKKQK